MRFSRNILCDELQPRCFIQESFMGPEFIFVKDTYLHGHLRRSNLDGPVYEDRPSGWSLKELPNKFASHTIARLKEILGSPIIL